MNFHFELGDEIGAAVYCASDLVLEGFVCVGRGRQKVILVYEILYFGIVLLYRKYNE